jgi:putative FmdB family regulatory protein
VQFERQQSFSEASLTRCPECSKKTLRKVYQPVGIVFKGSGFYATDHRSPSGAGRSSGSKSSEGETKSAAKESEKGSSEGASTEKPSSDKSSSDK